MSDYVKNQRLQSNPSGHAKRKNNFVRPSSAQQKKKDGSGNPEAENLRNLIIQQNGSRDSKKMVSNSMMNNNKKIHQKNKGSFYGNNTGFVG